MSNFAFSKPSQQMSTELLERVKSQALKGIPASIADALALNAECSTDELCDAADEVRRARCGSDIDTCGIVNARSGVCGEDCKWCAQSRHHHTGCETYAFVDETHCMDIARAHDANGTRRLSLVTSGRKVTLADIARFADMYGRISRETSLKLCASMGLLGPAEMKALRQAGVTRYHCNLETSADFFGTLCSTHTHADKLATIAAARDAGMEICSGGIIGMGESMEDRLKLAAECRDAGAVSMPVNLLNPIPGTPLADTPLLEPDEIVRSVALMRLVAPDMVMRFAGGRARLPREVTLKMLRGGINGVMIGDLLTTAGNAAADDRELIAEARD